MLFRDHVKDEGHIHGTGGSQCTALAEFLGLRRDSGVSCLRRIRESSTLAANAAASGQPWTWLRVADPRRQPHTFSDIAKPSDSSRSCHRTRDSGCRSLLPWSLTTQAPFLLSLVRQWVDRRGERGQAQSHKRKRTLKACLQPKSDSNPYLPGKERTGLSFPVGSSHSRSPRPSSEGVSGG